MKTSFCLYSVAIGFALMLFSSRVGHSPGLIYPGAYGQIIDLLFMIEILFIIFVAPIMLISLIIFSWIYQDKFFAILYTLLNLVIVGFIFLFMWA